MSTDLLGYAGGVEIFICESEWAYAYTIASEGDSEFITRRVDGSWVRVMGMGSPTCQDELLEMGAPESVVVDVLPCDVMYPPDQPTTPPADAPPVSDCTVETEVYGTAYAELIGVNCDEARAQWAVAATGHPGSWEESVTTPDGWTCSIAPYDPTSQAAGACYGPGDAQFVLYL